MGLTAILRVVCVGFIGVAPLGAQEFLEDGVTVVTTLRAQTSDIYFGFTMHKFPDVDGDGVVDLLISDVDDGENRGGTVKLFSGANGALLQTFTPSHQGAVEFGYGLHVTEDIDGDGVRDVVLGDPFTSSGGVATAFSTQSGEALWTVVGRARTQFGQVIADAGDLNNDGVMDIMVAGPHIVSGNGVYVASGYVDFLSGTDGTSIRVLEAPDDGAGIGHGLALISDIDGDGFRDHAIAATESSALYSQSVDRTGSVYFYSGVSGDLLFQVKPDGGKDLGFFWFNSDFDVNGDGFLDVMAADPYFPFAPSFNGSIYLFSGLDGAVLQQVDGTPERPIQSAAMIDDVDGDGQADIIGGEPFADIGGEWSGALSIFSSATGETVRTITNVGDDHLFGQEILTTDLTGDGIADLVVSAPHDSRVDIIAGVSDLAINGSYSGAWFDESHNGEGFLLEVLENDAALAYWFTYDEAGAQRWFVASGTVVGSHIEFAEVLVTRGGIFGEEFDPNSVNRTVVGELTIAFRDCNAGRAQYTIDGVVGSQNLSRLTSLNGAPCTGEAAAISSQSGSFFDASHNGEGFIVHQLSDTEATVYWFSYDGEGNQSWFFGVADVDGGQFTVQPMLITAGGEFGANFNPDTVEISEWGRLTINFDSCDTGVASYTGNAEQYGVGQQTLTRLTAVMGLTCTPK